MRKADPAVTEDWKWMGTPVWYCDGMVSLANPHRGKVKWTFAKGAHLADADHQFNAGLEGNVWRAIDIFEKDRMDEAALLPAREDRDRLQPVPTEGQGSFRLRPEGQAPEEGGKKD